MRENLMPSNEVQVIPLDEYVASGGTATECFSALWADAYGVPAEDRVVGSGMDDAVCAHLREYLPVVTEWLVETGVADELAEDWENQEFIPSMAEILLIRLDGGRHVDTYCDGKVLQLSIAVMDLPRLATAFVNALEDSTDGRTNSQAGKE